MKLWSLKGKFVLIVDDFAGMRTMLRNMLLPYTPEHISEASTGEEAINLICEHSFDIILCDYNLGMGKDGQQVLEEVKERELMTYSSIYIMTTAENTSEMVMGAVEYSPDDYLSKPFTKEVLISRLKKLLKRKSTLKKISAATQQRDYESAITFCDDELERKPSNRLELLKIKSELYLRLNDYDSVENIVTPILQEREIPWALLYLGQAHYHRQKYEEAKFIFEDLIDDFPNYLFAHDWLARIYQDNNNFKDAQNILLTATKKSPKAIRRQQILAEVAFQNNDLETSESTYKTITKNGKHSYYLGPDDYSGLASVYLKKGNTADALNTIKEMRKEFSSSNPMKNMKSLANEIKILNDLNRNAECNDRVDQLLDQFTANPGDLTSSDAIEVAKICYSLCRNDDANKFVQYAIRNNHDDKNVLDKIQTVLIDCGQSSETINSLMKSKDEVIDINNRGVQLATSGEISKSISLFVEAASAMPENNVINLNTAQSIIMHMNQSGPNEELMEETKKYLERVTFTGKPTEKYRMLTASFMNLQKSIDKIKPYKPYKPAK